MKRWLYLVLAATVLLPKGQEMDIGDLKPVELLYVYKEEGRIAVSTDTGDMGSGESLSAALKDLRETAAGNIFLDTVDYLLITEETKSLLPEAAEILRPSVSLVLSTGEIEEEAAAIFLSVHTPQLRMKDYVQGERTIPKLMTAGERYYLA